MCGDECGYYCIVVRTCVCKVVATSVLFFTLLLEHVAPHAHALPVRVHSVATQASSTQTQQFIFYCVSLVHFD